MDFSDNVLKSFLCLLVDCEGDGDELLAVGFVFVEHDNIALFGLAKTHDAQVKTIGREAQMVRDADGELAQERFFRGDAVAGHREVDALTMRAVDDGARL